MLKTFFGTLSMLKECVIMSLDNILSNKVRSFLTILGIMIGVTAVIALITTVSGVSATITNTFSSLGAGTLTLSITGSDLKNGLSPEDIDTLTQQDCVKGIAPNVSLRSRISHGTAYEKDITVSGKNDFYFIDKPTVVTRGRALNAIDIANRSFVCLLEKDQVETFFYGVDPIGQNLYIDGRAFLVVGIFSADEDDNIMSLLTGVPDLLIPYTTAMKMNSTNVVTSMTITLAEGYTTDDAKDDMDDVLDAMFSYEDDCYSFSDMSSIEETMETMTNMMSALLAGIASIALVVGGIGIMNMMLTTVTERTTEIGLKKALGALPWQIQIQFLIESFLLSLLGGIIGIILGLLLSLILCNVLDTTFVVSTGAIILGVSFSAAVGIIFGWAPARKASRLNPIDALRSM